MQGQEQPAESCPSPAGFEVLVLLLHPAHCLWALIHPLRGLDAAAFHLMGRDG